MILKTTKPTKTQNTPNNFLSCLFFSSSYAPLIFCFNFWLNCVWIGICHLPHFFQQMGLLVVCICGRCFFCRSRKKMFLPVFLHAFTYTHHHYFCLQLPHRCLISPNSNSWKLFSIQVLNQRNGPQWLRILVSRFRHLGSAKMHRNFISFCLLKKASTDTWFIACKMWLYLQKWNLSGIVVTFLNRNDLRGFFWRIYMGKAWKPCCNIFFHLSQWIFWSFPFSSPFSSPLFSMFPHNITLAIILYYRNHWEFLNQI